MNRYTKISKIFILFFLGAAVWWGCQAQEPEVTEEKVATPTSTPEQVVVRDTPVEITAVTPDPTPNRVTPTPVQDLAPRTVLVLSESKVNSLDPYQMVDVHPGGSIATHIWDTLTLLNDELQVEANLAESWRLLNNLTWEYKLREDISFHNGEPLNAEAVRFSIERAQSDPASLETFARDVGLDKVEIVDDYTVRLTTREAVANLPYHLAFLEILPPVYYSQTDPAQLEMAPVGSGPYQLSQWTKGEEVVLEAVPDYWKGPPTFSSLVFQTVPSVEDRLAALRIGQTALVTELPPMNVEGWNVPDSKLVAIESTQRMLVGIHPEENTPLANNLVRQALNYGINVQQITEDLLAGHGERYASWVNTPWNNSELQPWPYDPGLGRKLLMQAGYPDGFTVTLTTPQGVYDQDVAVAEAIAGQLAEIGVTVQVEAVDWNVYTRQLLSGNPSPLFLLALNSRGDGLEDVKNLSADFAFNPTGWHNFSFENLVDEAANTFNQNVQLRLLHQAQAVAYQESPWIWLWRSYDFYGVSTDLDWTPRRDGLVRLYKPLVSSTGEAR